MRFSHTPLEANSKSAGRNADESRMQMNSLGMDRAAPQHNHGSAVRAPGVPLWTERPAWPASVARVESMTQPKKSASEFFIQGITPDGQPFRPSDWAERLAGAMSCFRPDGVQGGIGSFIGYSPLCVPRVINGVKCVIVSDALRDIEPMAWDFVMNFARDNQLGLTEACLIPDDAEPSKKS
jgi:hypothetical protein